MWLNERNISWVALQICIKKSSKKENIDEYKKLITTPEDALLYCLWVKEDPEMRKLSNQTKGKNK